MSIIYSDDPMRFIGNVLGACSITKGVLQAYYYLPPDPEERDGNYRAHLSHMHQLCQETNIDRTPLGDIETLINLLDQFVAQERRVTTEQESVAESLRERYVAWCLSTFFEPTQEEHITQQ